MLYVDQELKTHYQELVQHAQLVTTKLLPYWLPGQRDFPVAKGTGRQQHDTWNPVPDVFRPCF